MSSLGKRTAKPGVRKLASPLGLAADIFVRSDGVLNSLPYSAVSVSHSHKERSLPSLVSLVDASVAGSAVKCPQLPDTEWEEQLWTLLST